MSALARARSRFPGAPLAGAEGVQADRASAVAATAGALHRVCAGDTAAGIALPASSTDLAFVRDAVCGRLALPAVPRIVRRLVELLDDDDVSPGAILAELECEPLLAARTLAVANVRSARRPVVSLADAIDAAGLTALRTLVSGCGLHAVFVDVQGVNLRRWWLDAGIAARAARAPAVPARCDPDAAYASGLLHAVGHLILCRAHPQALQRALAGSQVQRGAALAVAERAACGHAHPEVGAAWLAGLGLPAPVVDAVAHQLVPRWAPAGSLAALVQVATAIAAAADDGATPERALASVTPELLAMAGLAPADSAACLAAGYRRWIDEASR